MSENFQHLPRATTRIITHQGNEYLFFGGTAYLGLLSDHSFIDLYKQGLDLYGLNNGTSRNNNIQIDIYDKTEIEMARRFGFEDCLLLSSGYLAAQLVIRSLAGIGELLYAPGAHPALWEDRNPFLTGQTFESWKTNIIDYINHSAANRFVIVSNTLDNLAPQAFDFSQFINVHSNKELYFVLDDSHGIGVKGAGEFFVDLSLFKHENMHLILIASLAKGMGTDAGAIFCSTPESKLFRRSTFFTGASPSSPASMYALLHGLRIFTERSKLLQERISYLDTLVGDKVSRISSFPVFTVPNTNAFNYFKENKILISSFAYPLPSDPPINRIVLSAAHRATDLEHLAQVIASLE